ncbi:2-C-methyl-D-erythritol 4-phosphate cytidylyltransferase [Candidatus Pantoea edessiphila]|uniref:2-C-methyl-D-erythritol 4-phosphate cytidylyltransferase n=1 Tax=Candidatus Pantoea edessiphila TaxID=2044610 RepID=A0A2P5T1J2_9GAMM|nr:2-C-methyl-D-erythritol 4-phosphate cytidylyltransferase [Candidatus Pantoea edessiphila]PPI88464.1 2-C-methyl-D-erythritol 4-phosphate cytidylyltransferase [Candidatus Pantoea edessiphila]
MNNSSIKKDIIAIVPAAGIGKRMKIKHPKQYLTIGKYTILEHCIFSLFSHSDIKQVIIALNSNDQYFSKLPLASNNRILCVIGGDTRAKSVLAALKTIQNNAWVLIHDASRPCLHIDDLIRLIKIREKSNIGGILAIPINDTIKLSNNRHNLIKKTVERKNLWRALTPQFFPCSLLISCLIKALTEGIDITDEASALEYCGYNPNLIKGRNDNIKITFPEDLLLAELYLKKIFKGY